jgi:hypothetical protein
MNYELQELYKYLKLHYEPLTENDLSINEPDEDEDTEYICCDQKIITLKEGYFNICCLYDAHPCVRFSSNEEVLAFYEGYNEGYHYYFDDPIQTARAVGKIFSTHETLLDKEVETAVQKAVSPIQTRYNLEESNEN